MKGLRRWRFPVYDPDEADKLLREMLAKIQIAAKDAGDGDVTATLSLIDREGIEWVVRELKRLRIAERQQDEQKARLRAAAKVIASETGEQRFRKALAKIGLLVPESGVVKKYPEHLLEVYGRLINSDEHFLVSNSTELIVEYSEATEYAGCPMKPLKAVRFLANAYGASAQACLQELYRKRKALKALNVRDQQTQELLDLPLPDKRDVK